MTEEFIKKYSELTDEKKEIVEKAINDLDCQSNQEQAFAYQQKDC